MAKKEKVKHAVSCGAVVFHRGKDLKFLLLLHDAGHWEFPKGLREKGENPEQTALREVKEETGLAEIKFIGKVINKIHYFYKYKGTLISKDVIFFLAASKNMKVKISCEHKGFKWLPYKEAIKILTYSSQKETLKKGYQRVKRLKNAE